MIIKRILQLVAVIGALVLVVLGAFTRSEALYWGGAALFIIDEISQGFLFPGGERGALVIEAVMSGVYLALFVIGILIGGLAWWAWAALLLRKLIEVRRTAQAGRWGEKFRLTRRPLLEAVVMLIGFMLIYISIFPH